MIREIFLRDFPLWSCVWQSTIFLVVGLVSSFILRHRSARAHQVLFLAMMAAVIVPIMSILVKHYELGVFVAEPVVIQSRAEDVGRVGNFGAPGTISAEDIEHKPGTIEKDLQPATLASESTKLPWRSVVLYAWIAASLILATRLLVTFVLGARLLGRALPLNCEKIEEALRLARAKLGIDKDVMVRSSRGVRSPVIWCWRQKPVLLVPSAAGQSDNGVDWAGVLCHELAHWKRRDHISGLLAELAVCILPWHPLLWWAKSRLVRLSEQACDDWVVAIGQPGTDYAESLLDLVPQGQMAFVPAVVSSKRGLAYRIRRILKDKCGNPRAGLAWALVVSIVAVLLAAGVAFAQSRPAEMEETETGGVRIVHFPKDRSLGTLKLLDKNRKRQIATFFYWIDGHSWWSDWEYLGEAKGDVTVPAGKFLGLEINPDGWRDLSPLSRLRPDDLYELNFWSRQTNRAKASDRCLKHIEHLTGLKVLDLAFTNITGKGMRSVRNLKSLEYLTLPDRITDDGLADVAELQSLKGLYIKKNMITNAGLRHLAKLSSLEELELGGDRINDAALLHLAKLPSLQYLLLWDKNFTDTGMAYLKNAPSLRILHFGHLPQLTDAALVHLSQIPELERLSLHWNRNITDAGIVHLQKLRSLKMLDIGNSQVTNEGLAHLAKIKSLEYLALPAVRSTAKGFDHPITDKGLAHLAQLERLRYLNLGIVVQSGPITDEGLRHISRLQMLEELTIGGRSISNSGMEHIAKLTNLKKLDICAFNKVTDEGLAKLTALKSLKELSIGDYGAKITISGLSCLNAIPSLVELHLGGIVQDYSGLNISGLTKLEKLTFSLKGKPVGKTIVRDPVRDEDLACLANLKRLKSFKTGYGTKGQISNAGMSYLAELTNMEWLILYGSNLTDDGLRYLANMKKLNMLFIDSGKFTDKGLHHLEDIKSLESITLAGENYFSPAALKQFRKKLPNLYRFQTDKENAGGYGAIAKRGTL